MDDDLLYGKKRESIPCYSEHRARYIILNEFIVCGLREILHYQLTARLHVRILCRDDLIRLNLELNLEESRIICSNLKSAAVFEKIIERSDLLDNPEICIDIACQYALRKRSEFTDLA